MDLITSAVVAAIEHGAPGHAPETVASHYQRLKQAIAKFDSAAAILAAIAALEAEPSNTPLQLALSAANMHSKPVRVAIPEHVSRGGLTVAPLQSLAQQFSDDKQH